MPFTLRPYQSKSVDVVRTHIRRGVKRVLLVAPTGAGKTVIATHMIECSVALGNRVLFLAHRRELITQAFKKVIGCTCRPGYDHDSLVPDPECLGDGMPRKSVGVLMANDPRRNPAGVVQVASIDTLRNRAKPPADLIIVDEAHRTLSKTYQDLVAMYPEAAIIGLTATPYRADRRGLGEVYDELVVVSSPRQLIDEGALVDPRIFTVPAKDLPDLSRVRIKGNDYDPTQLTAAVDRKELVGSIVEHWKKLAADLRTVVFAASVEHSKHVTASFRDEGIAAEHLDGMTPTDERDAILARLERGETRVVVNYGVLVEGWDQPSVKCAILARPTKSTGAYLQMAGRILRPYQALQAIILDHAGCVLEHGLPQEDREFTLEAAQKKIRPTTAKTCPGCFAILPIATRLCTECGHAFEVAERSGPGERDGQLVEVRAATQDEKRAAWNEICATAISKGYQKGWAGHRYKEKYGTWPPNSFVFPERPRMHVSDAIKREHLENLREECATRGYRIEWVEHRYRAKFGEDVPAEWLLPRIAPVVAKAVNAPEPSPALEAWDL
jgi:superfamily II DNA or RNA helicase